MTIRWWTNETIVNTTTASDQKNPAVAVLNDGRFVIVWQDNSSGTFDVRGQLYGADGVRIDGEFTVADGAGDQVEPEVVAQADGGFVVGWQDAGFFNSRDYDAAGGSAPSFNFGITEGELARFGTGFVQVGRFADDIWINLLPGGPVQVNTTIAGVQTQPDAVQLDLNDRVAVVWMTLGGQIRARVYEDTGVAVNATDFQVNSTAMAGSDVAPKITALANGGFVVTWQRDNTPFPGVDYDVRARIFDSSGTALGAEFLVNSNVGFDQGHPEIVALKTGGFMVVWSDYQAFQIKAQQFDLLGNRVGAEVAVSNSLLLGTTANFGLDSLGAALLPDGRVAVTWHSSAPTQDDPTGHGVHLQILDPRDGIVNGTNAAETLYGGLYDDQISGQLGSDSLFGLEGNDRLFGGGGADLLRGGEGDDLLFGEDQNDQLFGDNGNDQLNGGAGNDTLDGGAGSDRMAGGVGDDLYIVDIAGDVIFEGSGGGLDTVLTSDGYTLGDDIERLFVIDPASTFAINLFGNVRDNEITGNDGANFIAGLGGNDILQGRGGADMFAFTSSIFFGIDQILDFEVGIDKIALDDGEFAGLALGLLAAGAFRTGSSAQDADDRIIYDPATGAVYFDADGNGAGAQVQFANLSNGLALSAGDFQVI